MNFIFISPAFPKSYYHFCEQLLKNGVNVLGIGDTPYAELSDELKKSLTEYYNVDSLENYDSVYRAVAFFAFKYGKIDVLESNNEYWLRQDAKLRTDFNIPGPRPSDVLEFTSKSHMKKHYEEANVPIARYKISTSLVEDLEFIQMVGYPIIAKPDCGVGAAETFKIKTREDLARFHEHYFAVPYILEEFIEGNIVSLDGICDASSNIVFCDNEIFPPSIMDIVNEKLEVSYYVNKEVPHDIYRAGQAVLKAFNIKSRYFHLEFFRLTKAKEGLGKVGDIVALETNMRPPGGYTPDMINYSQSTDTYKIYADIMTYNSTDVDLNKEKYYCIYVARRDRFTYFNDNEEIYANYKDNIKIHDRMPEIFEAAMGNEFFIAAFKSYERLEEFKNFILAKKQQ